MPKTRPPYSPEFRRQMVELVRAGRSPEDLAREFEPQRSRLAPGRLRPTSKRADGEEGVAGLAASERDELARLRRENKQLRVERDILSKAAAWFARETGAVPLRFSRFMSANQACFPVATMARVLGVSKAGYYRLGAPPAIGPCRGRRGAAEARAHGARQFAPDVWGARVHAELQGHGEEHGRKRIARLMRQAGLVGASHRHGGPVTTRRDQEARPAPDLVDRKFTASGARPSSGSPTSPMCRQRTGSCIWPWCWTHGAARSSAGRWPTICGPNWYWTRWRRRSASVGRST